MDFQSVVFYASPFMCFIGLAHQLTDVKIHLLIHFSSTLAFAAPKTMSNFQYKPDIDTDTLTPEEKNLFFFLRRKKTKTFRIQNCSLGNTIFGNKIDYKHFKGKFRQFPRCSLTILKEVYSIQDVSICLY